MKALSADIYRWISSTSFRSISRCTSGADSATEEIGSRDYGFMPRSNWFKDQIYQTSSRHSALSNKQASGSLLIDIKTIIVDWHDFHNDDKYFLVNKQGEGWQDSLLYSEFYEKLPDLGRGSTSRLNVCPGSVVIFSRSQFGHYLLDDLIPSLSIAKEALKGNHPITLLCRHKWQEAVGRFFANAILPESEITVIYLGHGSLRYILEDCYFAIPAFPDIGFFSRDLLHSYFSSYSHNDISLCKATNRSRGLYLSREGFEDEARVRNRGDVYSHLQHRFMMLSRIMPHETTFDQLVKTASAYDWIISEPGTTPLIAYLSSSASTRFLNLMSARCISDCSAKFFYSGWRYHLPYLMSSTFAWGKTVAAKSNPFSDIMCYDVNFILP